MSELRPNYMLSVDAALVLGYGTARQAVVKGLNKMKPPGLSRDVTSVSEFRRSFDIEFTTTGKISRITASGNMVLVDPDGQERLREYIKANECVQDARLYLNYDDFVMVDLANDPSAVWQVSKNEPGDADKNGVFPVDVEIVPGGLYCSFQTHLTATDIACVAEGNKITGAGITAAAGFKADQTLIVEGAGTNNLKHFLISAVAAGELTLDSSKGTVADAVAGEAVTLHAGVM
ncbi:hypothetical protein DesfrDRAFT_0053 [Solidesulfovibrio fructosivorans JJ]]|uniref:Uncharacterized protein n=1 Tax=Solidesulfovibrio fructosivorans JJ] TaxID=596151 RepID=E1JR04_SOLFR|nr:hypothetical protein [Solidesulfovibrio fructosivorans]EFL53005.1 hypothetical protein DesfrDRAFT_0053 [Solidesulfovibrio fructosivorans JJ]]